MGAVHLARIVGLGGFERFVVVKRILDTAHTETEVVERFLSEARIAATIHHANVVGTHHVGTDDSGLYMVLDYVEGSSWAALTDRAMLRGERLPIPIVLRIALDVLAGLEAVHRAIGSDGSALGVVHRDVSLQNILVGRDGVARLTDFGIARSARPSIKTKTGSLIGKLLYLPPEHIRQEPTDHTIDIYMLGVTLWCALTGEEPWPGSDEAQLMHRILTEPLPSIASRRGEPVAPEIEQLVATAAHPAKSQRYPSAAQMRQVIEGLGRDRGWVASQHEVATFVEGLVGLDLDRRRERIARAVSQVRPAQPSSATRNDEKAPQKATRWLLVAVAAVLSITAALYGLPTRKHNPTSNDLPLARAPLTIGQQSAAAPIVLPSPTPPVAAIGSSTSEPIASASPPRNPTVALSARPAPVAPARATPRTVPSLAPKPPPPSAPDDISPRNPYR
jgi:serine/threonine-protein kinase